MSSPDRYANVNVIGEFLSPAEFARRAGVTERTIQNAIFRGDLPVYRINGGEGRRPSWGVPPGELEFYVPRDRGFAPRR